MPEPGETFQTVESALSLCGQDTEASGAEVSPHPGPGAGTLMEPGLTPVLWGSLQDAHCPSPKVFSTLGVGFSRLGGWRLLPLHIPEEEAGSEGRSLGPVTED